MINKSALESKLDSLKIPGTVAAVSENSFYTSYSVNFAPDVTLNRIKARRDDIALFFGCPVVVDTESGRVFFKVTKQTRDVVSVFDFIKDLARGLNGYELPLIIGESEDGTRLFYDLVKAPHILAAGATGSGKSVFLHNCILSTMASGKSGIVLIDVKRVEFSIYEGVPHLCAPICYTARDAVKTLENINSVMARRYETLKAHNARNIKEFRDNGGRMQYITVFIDELADLLLTNKRTEKELIKIAQLGRAAGIHLILATQRPDSTIISGLIRANIPSRVCFAVQKATDSRIILDTSGGETLRGAGDGLFLPIGTKKPTRIQAPYISTSALITLIDKARHCND